MIIRSSWLTVWPGAARWSAPLGTHLTLGFRVYVGFRVSGIIVIMLIRLIILIVIILISLIPVIAVQ